MVSLDLTRDMGGTGTARADSAIWPWLLSSTQLNPDPSCVERSNWKAMYFLTISRDFAHVPRSFTNLNISVFLPKDPCSLYKFLLLFLEAPFFPETKLLSDLLAGNGLIVAVCKQQYKATWPALTTSFPFPFLLPPDGSEIMPRLSCKEITSPNHST